MVMQMCSEQRAHIDLCKQGAQLHEVGTWLHGFHPRRRRHSYENVHKVDESESCKSREAKKSADLEKAPIFDELRHVLEIILILLVILLTFSSATTRRPPLMIFPLHMHVSNR